MFQLIFSVVQEQYIVVTSLECPLAAVDSNVYSLIHDSQYELAFKNMLNYIYILTYKSYLTIRHRTSQTVKKSVTYSPENMVIDLLAKVTRCNQSFNNILKRV